MKALIKFWRLTKIHLPLSVKPYETSEGNEGFALYTSNNRPLTFDNPSYGYDSNFRLESEAIEVKNFLEKLINK